MIIRELKGIKKPLLASVAMLALIYAPCASFAQEQSAPPSTSTPDNSQQTTSPDKSANQDKASDTKTTETAPPSSAPESSTQKTTSDTSMQSTAPVGAAQNTAPDNSQHNKAQQTTAQQQPENAADRMTTRKIRRAIVADKSLSMYAHNVKIITQDGAVTLKGPVKSEEEKQAIVSKAAEVVGSPDKVMNQITVKQQ